MSSRSIVRFALSLSIVLAFVIAAYAGGWATITLSDFPDYAVAGKPLNLSFTVRQHGQTLLPDLRPSVRATTAGGLAIKRTATAGSGRGEYAASLTLPEPGEWTLTITSGFMESAITLPALKVIAAGAPEAEIEALATFINKSFMKKVQQQTQK